MKWLLLLSTLLVSCKEIQPTEQAATVVYRDHTYCGFCGGWFVNVDSTQYRAEIPEPYAKENNQIWIRYELNQTQGYKAGHWINIKSIRQR